MRKLAAEAQRICLEAFRKADSGRLVARHLALEGGTLHLGQDQVCLDSVDQIFVVALGKAALGMYRSAAKVLAGSAVPPIRAIVISNECLPRSEGGILYLHGAHPIPDESSIAAARAVLHLLRQASARTIVLYLISGGASAMMELPLDPAISISDVAGFHRALVASGLPIDQMNILRKHFSALKGGRLAEAAAAALRQYTLLISDVPGDQPGMIGSGPSLPDPSTWEDCLPLVSRLRQIAEIPKPVLAFFSRAPLETPKAAHPAFRAATWRVLTSSSHLADCAASLAAQAGFKVVVDNACDDWDYREAAVYLLDRAEELSHREQTCCVVSVGEVNVQLPPDAGEGGRNQQFALWCARELDRRDGRATVLSVGSDGIDGNSRAAGAVCDELTVDDAARLGMDVTESLNHFASSPLLHAVGAAIVTGPTGNNLRDLRMVFVDRT